MHPQPPVTDPRSNGGGTATTYDRTPWGTTAPGAPEWFHAAMARPYRIGSVTSADTVIRYLCWDPDGPDGANGSAATLLVHGGAAHAMWWAPIGATLDPGRRVVAMDLSGHGISGRRDRYSADLWIDEIAAVAAAISPAPVDVVGHSLGGILVSYAMARHPERFASAVLVDAPVWSGAPAPEGQLAGMAARAHRTYATLDAALARFRLVPPQHCANDWYVDHIARHGLVRHGDGWQWRFDPLVFAEPADDNRTVRFDGDLRETACPWAVVMGERSFLADSARPIFEEQPGVAWRVIPGAAHHVMLDEPLLLHQALQELLVPRS